MAAAAQKALVERLLPKSFLVTPNLPETAVLCGREMEAHDAARFIRDLGAQNVLIKGGHRIDSANDLLFVDGEFIELPAPRIETVHTHGTGCSYSAAITALLARGESLSHAVSQAKKWIAEAIRTNPGMGSGSGPVNHFA